MVEEHGVVIDGGSEEFDDEVVYHVPCHEAHGVFFVEVQQGGDCDGGEVAGKEGVNVGPVVENAVGHDDGVAWNVECRWVGGVGE